MTVHHVDEFAPCAPADRPDIGVIATPGWAAQEVADLMVRAGVTSVLNFAPRVLTVPPTVHLRYVDLSIELQVLGFYRSRRRFRPGAPPEPRRRSRTPWASHRRSGPPLTAGRADRPPAGDWYSGGRDRHNREPTQEGTECPSLS